MGTGVMVGELRTGRMSGICGARLRGAGSGRQERERTGERMLQAFMVRTLIIQAIMVQAIMVQEFMVQVLIVHRLVVQRWIDQRWMVQATA
jgi:hypothetical protein